mmetsp:Transcript_84291/g.202065  ORF Transcript_84291/g.202065 Transcript_84291/m.202065 type:complete len:308 (+) Transcript_84291:288-1211(+)
MGPEGVVLTADAEPLEVPPLVICHVIADPADVLEEGVRAQPALGSAAVPIIGPLVNHHTRQLAAVVRLLQAMLPNLLQRGLLLNGVHLHLQVPQLGGLQSSEAELQNLHLAALEVAAYTAFLLEALGEGGLGARGPVVGVPRRQGHDARLVGGLVKTLVRAGRRGVPDPSIEGPQLLQALHLLGILELRRPGGPRCLRQRQVPRHVGVAGPGVQVHRQQQRPHELRLVLQPLPAVVALPEGRHHREVDLAPGVVRLPRVLGGLGDGLIERQGVVHRPGQDGIFALHVQEKPVKVPQHLLLALQGVAL